MNTEIPFKFQIQLSRLEKFYTQNPKWDGGNHIYRVIRSETIEKTEKGQNLVILLVIENIIKELKIDRTRTKFGYTFCDYKNPLFVPCLANYLAVINIGEILPLLKFYWECIEYKGKKVFLDSLEKVWADSWTDYINCIGDIYNKFDTVSKWVEQQNSNLQDNVYSQETIFNLTADEIETIIFQLVKNDIILNEEQMAISNFLNNNFEKQVRFNTNKIVILDLLKRLIFKQDYKKNYTKLQIAQTFGGLICYFNNRKKTYLGISTKCLANGFSQSSTPRIRLLLSTFPEIDLKELQY